MKKKILIIEDNEQNMYLLTFLLEKNNFEIIQARNGKAGIASAFENKPVLILLDIQLPVMNGYEVAKKLKEKPETSSIPIVAVTSYAMAGDRENVLAAGCTGYIEKPIDPDTFVDRILAYVIE
ncbi:MAG: response regulator [bacterium]|nr:response regulator [bacterium]